MTITLARRGGKRRHRRRSRRRHRHTKKCGGRRHRRTRSGGRTLKNGRKPLPPRSIARKSHRKRGASHTWRAPPLNSMK